MEFIIWVPIGGSKDGICLYVNKKTHTYHVMYAHHLNKKILTSCIIISILLIGMSYFSYYFIRWADFDYVL